MGRPTFQTSLDSFVTPYSDDSDTSANTLRIVTPLSTPPPYNTPITLAPNQTSSPSHRELFVPPTPSDLEKGLPPSYTYNTSPINHESSTPHFPGRNAVFLLLPSSTTHIHLTSSQDAPRSQAYPSLSQTLSFVHISAALLTGVEVLDLLYLHRAEDFDVTGAGIFGAPFCLLWALLGTYFGSGLTLCFL